MAYDMYNPTISNRVKRLDQAIHRSMRLYASLLDIQMNPNPLYPARKETRKQKKKSAPTAFDGLPTPERTVKTKIVVIPDELDYLDYDDVEEAYTPLHQEEF